MIKPKLDPKILDDIARVAGGAVNIVSGLKQQVSEDLRSRMDDLADRADLVPREDLERAEAMIQKLRQRLDAIETRLDEIEGKKAAPNAAAKKTTKPKSKAPAKPKSKAKKK